MHTWGNYPASGVVRELFEPRSRAVRDLFETRSRKVRLDFASSLAAVQLALEDQSNNSRRPVEQVSLLFRRKVDHAPKISRFLISMTQ
ncbi:hypothetical protein [Sphingobacterium suaedae]|uniref:Uncharacterized protein n=1 Tax=Sphingobacterium suaedae TaxID=1686402 RepID=A0ABW5KI97_9SPHI